MNCRTLSLQKFPGAHPWFSGMLATPLRLQLVFGRVKLSWAPGRAPRPEDDGVTFPAKSGRMALHPPLPPSRRQIPVPKAAKVRRNLCTATQEAVCFPADVSERPGPRSIQPLQAAAQRQPTTRAVALHPPTPLSHLLPSLLSWPNINTAKVL